MSGPTSRPRLPAGPRDRPSRHQDADARRGLPNSPVYVFEEETLVSIEKIDINVLPQLSVYLDFSESQYDPQKDIIYPGVYNHIFRGVSQRGKTATAGHARHGATSGGCGGACAARPSTTRTATTTPLTWKTAPCVLAGCVRQGRLRTSW